jgi:proteasome lid subunit RPN8/RPN11
MKVQKQIIARLLSHAKKEDPIEACGYLAGKNGVISLSYELKNVDQSTEHFSFDPKEQFAAVKDARTKGLEICGVYHSHPASPARPSAEDIKLAYDPNILYFILSLAGGKEDLKAFKIKDQKVEAVTIEAVDDDGI